MVIMIVFTIISSNTTIRIIITMFITIITIISVITIISSNITIRIIIDIITTTMFITIKSSF